MNPPPTPDFWWQALGALALQCAVPLGLAGLAQTVLRSPRGRRATWLGALLALPLVLANSLAGLDRPIAGLWAQPAKPTPQFVVRPNLPAGTDASFLEPANAGLRAVEETALPEPVALPAASPGVWWPAWVWLTGIVLVSGWAALPRIWLAAVLRRGRRDQPPDGRQRVARIAERLGLGQSVRLLASPKLAGPIAFGVLRPSVAVPTDFWSSHTQAEQDVMLAHELAHLAVRDPLWLALADTLAALLWWHPLVWWGRRQLRAASEAAADEASLVVEDGPVVLAGCLVALASQWQRRGVLGLLGMAGFRSGLGRRVERLLRLKRSAPGPPPLSPWQRCLLALGSVTALAAAIAVPFWVFPVQATRRPPLLAMIGGALTPAPKEQDTAALPPTVPPPANPVDNQPEASRPADTESPSVELRIQLPSVPGMDPKTVRSLSMDALTRRLCALECFSRVKCEPTGEDQVRLLLTERADLAGGTNALAELMPIVKQLVEQPGRLEFRRVHPQSDSLVRQGVVPDGYRLIPKFGAPGKPARWHLVARDPFPGVTNTNLLGAAVVRDLISGRPKIQINFDRAGAQAFGELTRASVGQQVAVVLDGTLLIAPHVIRPITGEQCEISGDFTESEVTLMVAWLQHPLPGTLKLREVVMPPRPGATPNATPDVSDPGRRAKPAPEFAPTAEFDEAQREAPRSRGRSDAENATPKDSATADTRTPPGATPVPTSAGRSRILAKLDATILDKLEFPSPGATLGEVIRHLAAETRLRDPDRQGLNFIVVPYAAAPTDRSARDRSLMDLRVVLSPALTKVRLADVLDAVVQAAAGPIRYSIEDYGIVFRWASPQDPEPLFNRTYRVNPELLVQHLTHVGGSQFANLTNLPPGEALRRLLALAGLDFAANGTNASRKALFYEEPNGLLFVRATRAELETVEQRLQVLNAWPPQVMIEAKFVEITHNDGQAPGLDWLPDTVPVITNGPVGPVDRGATNGASSATGVFPGFPPAGPGGSTGQVAPLTGLPTNPRAGAVIAMRPPSGTNSTRELRGDQLQWPGRDATNAGNIKVSAAVGASLLGVLSEAQLKAVMAALEPRAGVDVLSTPRVTTLSGRQAQIQVADIRTVITGSGSEPLNLPGAAPPTNPPPVTTAAIPVGPTLDVIPHVAADGHGIRLAVNSAVTEFLGYDEPPQGARGEVQTSESPEQVAMPRPRFRVCQMQARAQLGNGQTLVLGSLPIEETRRPRDKGPAPRDLSPAGGLSRGESAQTVHKTLVVFVTATLVDPAGNPVHPAGN